MAEFSVGEQPTSIEKNVKMKGPMNAVAAVVIVAVVLVGLYFMTKKEEVAVTPAGQSTAGTDQMPIDSNPQAGTPDATSATEVQPAPTPSPVASSNVYKDGTYTAVGSYNSPAGPEQVSVTLTLKDDVVTDASAEGKADMPTSKRYQGQFVSGFKAMVVGKKLDDVMLDKVSGSSLTPKGFNDAVAKIKVQAKA